MGNTFLAKVTKSVIHGYSMNIDKKMIKSNIPKIRFNNFKAFWVEKRIADIVKISAGGDVDKVKLKESGKYPVVANALTNKGIVGFYDDYKVKAPAVTVTGRGDVGYAVARHENFTPVVRLLTLQSENIDVDYLENQINSMRILNESTGVPQLTAPQLGNYKVYHPEIDEQSAIGSLFRTLDDLLASYKDNLINYQSLKATMLSKMFPKAGQTVPEIRLDGFEGEWKIKRADEIFKSVSEKNRALLPVLSASQIDGMVLRDEIGIDIKYDEATLNNYKVVKPGQFVIHLRSFQGGFALSKLEGITSPAYTIIDFIDKENHLPGFWNSILTSKEFIKRLETVTYGIRDGKSISFKDFSSLKFVFPNLEEQQAIGSYFSNLDNLINTYQEKISKLETLKKKLLQDMFI